MVQGVHYKFPIFDGIKFLYWKERMELHLETLQNGIWEIIQMRYPPPQGGAQTPDEINLKETHAKVGAIIFSCITDSMFGRVKGLKEAKIVWEKLSLVYEGDPKTK